MDDALRREGDDKWSADFGYAFPRRMPISGTAHWSPRSPAASSSSTIYLLKLHGSINWQLDGGRIKLKQRLHSQHGTPRFTIIPPEWNKSVREAPVFNLLWRRALRAIRGADRVVIIGFSFTPTDLHVESLFRLGLAKARLKTLVIANPSSQDRQRIRRVFARALGTSAAVVRQYETLAELSDARPDCIV